MGVAGPQVGPKGGEEKGQNKTPGRLRPTWVLRGRPQRSFQSEQLFCILGFCVCERVWGQGSIAQKHLSVTRPSSGARLHSPAPERPPGLTHKDPGILAFSLSLSRLFPHPLKSHLTFPLKAPPLWRVVFALPLSTQLLERRVLQASLPSSLPRPQPP